MRSRLALRLAGMTNEKRVALILPVAPREAGLIARGDFRCAKRIRKPGFGGAGFQRLLLAFMRRPAAKVEDFESRAHLAAHAREAIGVNLERLGERIPPHRLS